MKTNYSKIPFPVATGSIGLLLAYVLPGGLNGGFGFIVGFFVGIGFFLVRDYISKLDKQSKYDKEEEIKHHDFEPPKYKQ